MPRKKKQPITYSVWIDIEEYDPNTDEYTECDAPGSALEKFESYEEAADLAERLAKMREFVEQIARMHGDGYCRTHDEPGDPVVDGGDGKCAIGRIALRGAKCDIFEMPSEDALDTVNRLIKDARELTTRWTR